MACKINKDIFSSSCNYKPIIAAIRAYVFNRKDITISKTANLINDIQNVGANIGYSLDVAKNGAIDFGNELVSSDNLPDYFTHFVKFPIFENDSESLLNIDSSEDLVIIIETTTKQFFALGVDSGLFKSVDTNSGYDKDIEYRSEFELFSAYEVLKDDHITTKELLESLLSNLQPLTVAATFLFNQEGDILIGSILTTENYFEILQGDIVQRFDSGYFESIIDPTKRIQINGNITLLSITSEIMDINVHANTLYLLVLNHGSGYLNVSCINWLNIDINTVITGFSEVNIISGANFGNLSALYNSSLIQSNIDNLLIQADNSTSDPNYIDIRGCGTPGGAGLLAKDNLITKGWTVLTD